MKQFCIILLLICSITVSSIAQDNNFTQYYASPMNLNPALTGGFDGTYRFSFLYRDQWRQVLENPLSSFAAALDLRFPVGAGQFKVQDAAGVGLMFNTDRMSTTGYSQTGMHFFGAYHKSLNSKNNQFLSFGLQLGLNQRNISNTRLTFEDQFNGSTGYTGSTNELLPPENTFPFADLSTGINYSYAPNRKVGLYLGAAMHHILEPQVSFYFDRRQNDDELGTDFLHRKYTAHASVRFPITSKVSLFPRVLASLQGPHLELNAGSNIRFALGEYGSSAMHIGGWVRPVSGEEKSLDLETAIMMVGFETNNVLFGFSYDVSISDIQSTYSGQGAFEISIAYLGNYDNETILCPKF